MVARNGWGVPLGMCHRRRVGHQPTMRGGLAGRGASQRGRARGLAWWARPEGRAYAAQALRAEPA